MELADKMILDTQISGKVPSPINAGPTTLFLGSQKIEVDKLLAMISQPDADVKGAHDFSERPEEHLYSQVDSSTKINRHSPKADKFIGKLSD